MSLFFVKSESLECTKVVVSKIDETNEPSFFHEINSGALKLCKNREEAVDIPQKKNKFASLAFAGRYSYFIL